MPDSYHLMKQQLTSPQTLLPVIKASGQFEGFILITRTVFNGNETSITLGSGPTVTLNKRVSGPGSALEWFMAASFSPYDERTTNWVSFPEYFPWTAVQSSRWWYCDLGNNFENTLGVMDQGMLQSLDRYISLGPSAGPVVPITPPAPGTLDWTASLLSLINAPICAYFEFNWASLFLETYPTKKPVSAVVASAPSNLRIFLVSIAPTQDEPINNTVRVVKLDVGAIPTVSDYAVVLTVTDSDGGTYTATLTLTVS